MTDEINKQENLDPADKQKVFLGKFNLLDDSQSAPPEVEPIKQPVANKPKPAPVTAPIVLKSPDFTKIRETVQKSKLKYGILLVVKVLLGLVIVFIITSLILGLIYYRNIKQAYSLSFSAKDNLESAVHKIINREFKEAANLIQDSNAKLTESKRLLDQIILVRYFPYASTQMKAVDNLLIAGIKLTDSGQKVVLLIEDITAPLHNESITYLSLTSAQKRDILDKIVASESLLTEVKGEIDDASLAIDQIPDSGLIGPLRQGIVPVKEYMPKLKSLIDHTLPMLRVIPKVVGFDQAKSYLFLLQNNSELRPTGGFIGTYGILKLQDGEIKEFQTDNVYNLDRAPQTILQEPSPAPIAKYLEQKNWSLRDINWSPDFPTTAEKALYMYIKENEIWQELKESGTKVIGEEGVVVSDIIPYQEVDGVIAVTPEIIKGMLKLTGPITVQGIMFTDENLVDELEFRVGREYRELGIPISQRKAVIKELADEIKLRLMSLPIQRVPDILQIAFTALDQKQVLLYVRDKDLEKLVLDRGWGGEVKNPDSDYVFVVDTNLASLKTDQYVDRTINYSLAWQGSELIGNVAITYKNNADFTWKSTRLRSYTRVYVPLGSELVSSSGAMENDKLKDPAKRAGQVDVAQELNKTYFGAFISIEPHETGVLSFSYKLPQGIKEQIKNNNYNLLVQKQPGVIPHLTLNLKFDKNIKSANPPEQESEWFNTSYSYATALNQDKQFSISLK